MIRAYNNDEQLKAEVIADMKADIEAERLVPGDYWNGHAGCHIGCVLHARAHRTGGNLECDNYVEYERQLGVPQQLAHLIDSFFEALPDGKRQQFSLNVLEAIPVGADLSDVVRQWIICILADIRQYAREDMDALSAIDIVTPAAWDADSAAAWDAAWAAAWAADGAVDRFAVRVAASAGAVWDTGRVAARAAARAAAASAAASDADGAASWGGPSDAAWTATWTAVRAAQAAKLCAVIHEQ